MRILAIETATDRCGVAVAENEAILANLLLARPRSHAEFLVPMIEQALRLARVEAAALDIIAVSMGPGSYTGLRIGVSTAKGLAYANGARLIGIPSLEALAHAVADHAAPESHVLSAFAARRSEVYAALYRVVRKGEGRAELISLGETEAVPVAEMADWLPEVSSPVLVAGDGADAILPVLRQARSTTSYELSPILPDAAAVARLAFAKGDDAAADLASFEPFYLKEFVAKKPKRTIFDRLPF